MPCRETKPAGTAFAGDVTRTEPISRGRRSAEAAREGSRERLGPNHLNRHPLPRPAKAAYAIASFVNGQYPSPLPAAIFTRLSAGLGVPLTARLRVPFVPDQERASTLNCSNCGTENEPGRKFCKECGSALVIICDACGSPNSPAASSAANAARRSARARPRPSRPPPRRPPRRPSAASSRSCSPTSSARRTSRS